MSTATPLVWVDLIEDKPKSFNDWGRHLNDDYLETDRATKDYDEYVERFQPWRLLIIDGDNNRPLFKSTESYFNEADAKRAATIAFANQSNVYLRQAEHGDVELRLAGSVAE